MPRHLSPLFALMLLLLAPGCDSADTFQLPLEPDPILGLSTRTLTFGTGEVEKTISIENRGGGFLTWDARVAEDWVTLSDESGTEGDQLTITIDRSTLDPGEYNATVTFVTNGLDDNLLVTLVLTLEESLIGEWTVFGARSGDNQLEGLIATLTFVDEETYRAFFDDGSNTGDITAGYTISGKNFFSNLPLMLELNGMSSGMENGQVLWTADMNATREVFDSYGGTALGWANEDGLQIDIEDGLLSLATGDANISFLYERAQTP